jgi:parallel beta-helix repeat protein
MRVSRSSRRVGGGIALAGVAAASVLLGAGVASAASAHAVHPALRPLYVSPTGRAHARDVSCKTAAYSTIGGAVASAPVGGKVIVCPGVYREDVSLSKRLTLEGRHAVIDASGKVNGIHVTASGSQVHGFTVMNAQGEGVLVGSVVPPVSTARKVIAVRNVTIANNVVENNDLGALAKSPTYPECQAQGQIPGDCGEGIHLAGAMGSHVTNNVLTGNSGGVLLTDEAGPTAYNVISKNLVIGNLYDCGITLAAHNPNVVVSGHTHALVGGVYKNTVSGNTAVGNGTKGEGAGVLIAVAGPGTANFGNTIVGNELSNNELAGVTVHAHSPGVNIGGNRILSNLIFTNNTGSGDYPNGPTAGHDTATTGILVYSAAQPLSITIANNQIIANAVGVWRTTNVSTPGIASNTFIGVGTNVVTSTP